MKTRSLISASVILGVVAFTHTIQSQEKTARPVNTTFGGKVVEPLDQTRTAELKQTYLDLITAQAALMDEATLQEEIQVTQKNIDELKALQQLNEARRLLLAITADYPKTEAAGQANTMLDSLESTNTQAEYNDDIGPALNANAGLPFTRSSYARQLPPSKPRTSKSPRRGL